MVSPAAFKHVGTIPTQPVGAGPFKLTSYVPDSHANLVRNPGYWDASQIHIANFTVQDITQPEQILAALESGQVNVAYIAGNQVAAAKAAGFKIAVIPSEVVNELDIQTTTAPFTNPKVVEGDQLRDQPAGDPPGPGVGIRGGLLPAVPEGFVGYSAQLANVYPYNPTKAKQLLAKAGLRQRPEDHADRAPAARQLAGRADPGPARTGRHHGHDQGTSRPTPRPSTSTSTRPSRSRSTARPGACRRWRCSTSSTASRA